MKAMLTSSLGGAFKVNGIRIPDVLLQQNGLLDNLKSIWIQDARVLIICANPDEYSDTIVHAFRKFSAPFSGKAVHTFPEQSAVIN